MKPKPARKTSKKISKKDTIKKAIEKNPEVERMLLEEGMMCAGCPMAIHETIEEGIQAHGIDANKVMKRINKK